MTPAAAAKKRRTFAPKAFLSTIDGGRKIETLPRKQMVWSQFKVRFSTQSFTTSFCSDMRSFPQCFRPCHLVANSKVSRLSRFDQRSQRFQAYALVNEPMNRQVEPPG